MGFSSRLSVGVAGAVKEGLGCVVVVLAGGVDDF